MMKSKIFFIGFVSIMLSVGFFSCSHDVGCGNEEEEPAGKDTMQMTLTVKNVESVRMSLSGIGLMTVDFGDGTPTVTYLDGADIVHVYSDTDLHVVTITGDYMTSLSCNYNGLVSLDVSRNPMLTSLSCRNCELTNLDVSKNTMLTSLDCTSNQLSALDLSKNTVLTYLNCVSNQLTDLDLSKSAMLRYLDCRYNQLTNLDVSKCTALPYLDCGYNQLTNLDVSKNTMLTDLYCRFNQLTNLLVVSKSITELYCESNQLTNLDVSKSTALVRLNCSSNQLSATALNDIFKALPSRSYSSWKGSIWIGGNPGSDDCDRNIADNRGWGVFDY